MPHRVTPEPTPPGLILPTRHQVFRRNGPDVFRRSIRCSNYPRLPRVTEPLFWVTGSSRRPGLPQPIHAPIMAKSLTSPPPIPSRPVSFSKRTPTRNRKLPPPTAPIRASRGETNANGKNEKARPTRIPGKEITSGIILCSRSINAMENADCFCSFLYWLVSAWRFASPVSGSWYLGRAP